MEQQKTIQVQFSFEKYNNGFISLKFEEDTLEDNIDKKLGLLDEALKLTRYRLIVDISPPEGGFKKYNTIHALSFLIYSRGGSKCQLNPFFDLIVTYSGNFPLKFDHTYLKTLDVMYNNEFSSKNYNQSISSHDLTATKAEQLDMKSFWKLQYTEGISKTHSISKACMGGTFDYLHIGHKLLLVGAIFTTENILIGLTAEELLLKKSYTSARQSYTCREQKLRNFLTMIASTHAFSITLISDPVGPAATVKELEAIIVTEETRKGGDFVNLKRKENGFDELQVVVVELISSAETEKVSSTTTRKFVLEQMRGGEATLKSLYEQWIQLNKDIKVENQGFIDKWFDRFKQLFCEPWRFYHNFNHVYALLQLINKNKETDKDENILRLVAWFHDLVYIPLRHDNEEASAAMFEEFAKEVGELTSQSKLDPEIINDVKEIIIFTKNHMQKNPKIESNISAQLFLDMDMAILGAEKEEYNQYSQNIRLEYSHVQEDAFKTGRSKVLETFLKTGSPLYRTQGFRDTYEEKARLNLRREIDSLLH